MLYRAFNRLLALQTPSQLAVDGAWLQAIGRDIWVADRELMFIGGLRLPIRMVVVRNESGDLLCYSPVALDEPTIEALAGIGEVRWVVAPNQHHGLFSADYLDRYPRARELDSRGCAGIGVDAHCVSLRSDFQELVIYHDRSKTLIVSDMLLNIRAGDRRLEWLLRLNGAWQRAGHTRIQRLLLLRDRRPLADFYRWALARPFEQISMSHGQLISEDSREIFYQVFHGFLRAAGRQSRPESRR